MVKDDRNENLKQWILKQRMQNYGYDYKWFNKMNNKKAQLKKQIQNMNDLEIRKTLAKAGILGKGKRLTKTRTRSGERVWDYTTGQSFNEELLNIMQLSASKGKKSFWEVQDKWWD